jgi:hypothetical protein
MQRRGKARSTTAAQLTSYLPGIQAVQLFLKSGKQIRGGHKEENKITLGRGEVDLHMTLIELHLRPALFSLGANLQ